MSKFKKEELLEYFDELCVLILATQHCTEIDGRAVAIREMIQKEKTRVSMAEVENIVSAIRKHPNFIEAMAGLSAWLEVKAGVEVVEK